MSNDTTAVQPADPGETGYNGYWRGVYEAAVPPCEWDEIPEDNQDAWRNSAADVLAQHGPAELGRAIAEIRRVRDALHDRASEWTDAAIGLAEKRAAIPAGPDRAELTTRIEMLRSHARILRSLAPILLEMGAAPPAEPYQAGLIPQRVARAAPGTAAGGTL